MNEHSWIDQFLGAYATPTLVGRTGLLDEIRRLVVTPAELPTVVCLVGDGGVGKTRLLNAVLDQLRDHGALRVGSSLVDFYHAPTHNAYGLVQEMYRILTPPFEDFRDFDSKRRVLERMTLSGEAAGAIEQRTATIQAFSVAMVTVAEQRRVVLALDTAERLLYQEPPLQGTTLRTAESWLWLVEQLPKWQNVALLVAGRLQAEHLFEALKTNSRLRVKALEVHPFSDEESLRYFSAAEAAAEMQGAPDVRRRIQGIGEGDRRKVHVLSGGRPINLALFIDCLTVSSAGQLPAILREVESLAEKVEENRPRAQQQMEQELVRRLREAAELGDTIVALGRAPKGVDAVLLQKLLGISSEEAQHRLGHVRRFSFVKIRPADERTFLHDEIYALLQRHLYGATDDDEAAARADAAILAYYEEKIAEVARQLNKFYAPVEEEGKDRLDLRALADAYDRRRALVSELVYYLLHCDPRDGFRRYYRSAREAVLSGDVVLEILLQSELLDFLAGDPGPTDASNASPADLDLMRAILATRPVERACAAQQLPDAAVFQDLERIRRESAYVLEKGGPAATATLDVWEAVALTIRGQDDDTRKAQQLLDSVIKHLSPIAQESADENDLRHWVTAAVLAFAYRARGYLNWQRGFMQQAIVDYEAAARLWREVGLKLEMAVTLNDMGFAIAERGKWKHGRALVKDALELRRQLGPRSPVALSLNTLAAIDIQEGDYASAVTLSGRALALFRAVEDRRGVGLALTALSEALRRLSGTELVVPVEAKVDKLREARDCATEAVAIFDDLKERVRLVNALTELGCVNRQLVKIRRDHSLPRESLERLKEASRGALEQAAKEAGVEMLYGRMDALVDLAWLGYISEDTALTEKTIEELETGVIPSEYLIDPKTGEPSIDADVAQVQLWPQIGKLFVLKGHLAYDDHDLGKTAENYLWGLEYSTLYGEEYHNLVRAMDEIYTRLKTLSKRELVDFSVMVERVERENSLGWSQRSKLHSGRSAIYEFLRDRALWYGSTQLA